MKKEKLDVDRHYRISSNDDKKVKKMSKKYGGESAYIRTLIRGDGGGLPITK